MVRLASGTGLTGRGQFLVKSGPPSTPGSQPPHERSAGREQQEALPQPTGALLRPARMVSMLAAPERSCDARAVTTSKRNNWGINKQKKILWATFNINTLELGDIAAGGAAPRDPSLTCRP